MTADDRDYLRFIEPHRRELHAHCYRMLGSVHDAEDALQETSLRAWRAMDRFQGRSSLRTWLYTIATNVCLNDLSRRSRRGLPVEYASAADPHDGPGRPLAETVWVEPYPDAELGLADGPAGPEARYEQREAVELAFIAALQHLPATQRAALILREVLGFSAREVAAMLDTTVPAVNSALQRARKAVDDKLPDRSQQATLRALGDERLNAIVERYLDAMQRADVEAVVELLTEDVAWSMPPLATWFGGLRDVEVFLRKGPLSGRYKWRRMPTQVNGQPGVAAYTWVEQSDAFLPFALDVLTFEGERISQVTAFITRTTDLPGFEHWPEDPLDPEQARLFERFGLPVRLSGSRASRT